MNVKFVPMYPGRHKLTEFFIASELDLNGLLNLPPHGKQNGLADSEVDLLMLCNLESILTGIDWENVFDRDYVNPVRDHGPEGPWIYQVSEQLLDALKQLSPDAKVNCAQEWAQTDEWHLRSDAAPEKIAGVLDGLISMAQRAGDEGKRLFIWTEP